MISIAHVSYVAGSTTILSDVSLNGLEGNLTAIVGPNGAGKSTALRLMAGDLTPHAGEVRMAGKWLAEWPLQERAKHRAVLRQHNTLSAHFSVLEVALLGRTPHAARPTPRDVAIAQEALTAVDMQHAQERSYQELSGGEQQRVQTARIFAQVWEPVPCRVLLLDEPTASLDLAHQHLILAGAQNFAAEGAAVVCTLHDLNLAMQYANHVLVLHRGRGHAFGTPREVFTPLLLSEVFGVAANVTEETRTGVRRIHVIGAC